MTAGADYTSEDFLAYSQRRYYDALRARDWDAVRATLAESYVLDDRRRGLRAKLDREGQIERERASADLGLDVATNEVIDKRSDRLVLTRHTRTVAATGFVIEVLAIFLFDDGGRTLATVNFDPDDLEAARAELDRIAAQDQA